MWCLVLSWNVLYAGVFDLSHRRAMNCQTWSPQSYTNHSCGTYDIVLLRYVMLTALFAACAFCAFPHRQCTIVSWHRLVFSTQCWLAFLFASHNMLTFLSFAFSSLFSPLLFFPLHFSSLLYFPAVFLFHLSPLLLFLLYSSLLLSGLFSVTRVGCVWTSHPSFTNPSASGEPCE